MIKPKTMQKKILLRTALMIILFAGSFIVITASSKSTNSPKTCTESMDDCCKKGDNKASSGEMIWESLSHQFFSTSDFSN